MNVAIRAGRLFVALVVVALVAALLLADKPSGAAPAAQANRKLSGAMQAGGDVRQTPSFVISPDSRYVVYAADAETEGAYELYSAPTTGESAPVRLSGLLPSGSAAARFAITPDSSRVVYIAPQATTGVDELYVTAIGGGAATAASQQGLPHSFSAA